jgi:hypothetical protein
MAQISAPREATLATSRGREAFVSGQGPGSNPYPPGSVAYAEWLMSWTQDDEECDESVHALIMERGRLGK